MSMTQTTSSRGLPKDLVVEILSRLPVKTIRRLKSVSKSLLNLIISPEFVELHLRRLGKQNSNVVLLRSGNSFFASVDLDQPQRPVVQIDLHPDLIKFLGPSRHENYHGFYIPNSIIGICKGVVCFGKMKEYALYNPATRAYKQVPIPNASPRTSCFAYREEFVYDCISDDFKIIRFVERYNKRTRMDSETCVYSLKDNSWSKIRNPPPGMRLHRSCNHIGGNCLYWIIEDIDSTAKVLVRFDISSNTYEEMSVPARVVPSSYPRLGVLNGRLHITRNGKKPEIWMLNEDNCWTLVFRCSSEWEYPVKRCLFYSIDGRKIFLGIRHKVPKFICCDLHSQTTSVIDILGLPEDATFKPLPWAESRVPLM